MIRVAVEARAPEKVGQYLVMGVDRQERILLTRLFRQGI